MEPMPENHEAANHEEAFAELCAEELPRIDDLVTEDDTPVDNLPSEKQQRLLTEPLYSSWAGPGEGRTFLAAANVGLFASVHEPPLVPDAFLSLDVKPAADWWAKTHRSYFFWEFGKAPEVVIEVVSNTKGGERDRKMHRYARMGISYYVIYDPLEQVQQGVLRAYALNPWREYEETVADLFTGIGLGLRLWRGVFETREDQWLRWHDAAGNLVLTGAERAERERARAENERARAEAERARADQERARAEQQSARAEQQSARAEQQSARAEQQSARAERLAARLRALGVDPEDEASG